MHNETFDGVLYPELLGQASGASERTKYTFAQRTNKKVI